MSDLIAYDRPVKDYIAKLNATGHVTHASYKKTSVTLHHNAGILSIDQILDAWRNRDASAHFDVDASGNIAQFVKVGEYAWAVGATGGNETSISIEMCNSKGAPSWAVGDATLASATRLAGWLFAYEIKQKPTAKNFFPHEHWSATECPGPYVMGKWSGLLSDVVSAYNSFTVKTPPKPTPPPVTKHETVDEVAIDVIAGKWGNDPARSKALTAAGYNAAAVQAAVNAIAGGTKEPVLTIAQVAKQVIAGKWGNGADRVSMLKSAGYNPTTVQAEVNRELS